MRRQGLPEGGKMENEKKRGKARKPMTVPKAIVTYVISVSYTHLRAHET